MELQQSSKKAYITLLSVVVLTAIASVMITGTLLITTENFQANQKTRLSLEAKALAETCVEIALDTLKGNVNYTGNVTQTFSFGTCEILTISGTGNTNRTITTQSTISGVTKRMQVVIQTINPNTIITSWQEIL